MVLEINNTKAMLFCLLKSDIKDYAEMVGSICTFTSFHSTIGDYSDKLICQTVELLQQKQTSELLLIKCFRPHTAARFQFHLLLGFGFGVLRKSLL